MVKAKQKPAASEIDDLLRQTAEAERRLLKRERQAEKRVATIRADVAEAHDRLTQAQERLARRTEALAAAERELHEHRTARAAGPLPLATEPAAPAAPDDPATAPNHDVPVGAPPRRRRSRSKPVSEGGAAG